MGQARLERPRSWASDLDGLRAEGWGLELFRVEGLCLEFEVPNA